MQPIVMNSKVLWSCAAVIGAPFCLSSCAGAPSEAAPKSALKPPARGHDATARRDITASDAIGATIVTAARRQVGTRYTQEYFSIDYPNGDPPRNVGACTDVVVRALRPVGYDLQKLMHEDMKRHFDLYPRRYGLRRTDSNIDHRRVPNQRVYFTRFAQKLTTKVDQSTLKAWQPGDIVYWKLENDLDHVGIISDRRAADGMPFVIHNLGGCREELVLTEWHIADHFRFPKR